MDWPGLLSRLQETPNFPEFTPLQVYPVHAGSFCTDLLVRVQPLRNGT